MTRSLLFVLALGAAARAGDGIEWAESLEKAKAESARDGRPVIAYFTFDT